MLSTAMALLTCAFGLDTPAFSCALITMEESVARSAVGDVRYGRRELSDTPRNA